MDLLRVSTPASPNRVALVSGGCYWALSGKMSLMKDAWAESTPFIDGDGMSQSGGQIANRDVMLV